MQSSFKEYFQLIVFQKLLDWRLEKSYMKKHTCHLDHHLRSHYVTIGQTNRVQKLIDNQKGKLLDNQEEKLLNQQNSSNQPNQFQIQFVKDQGDLVSSKTWSMLKHVHLKTVRVSMLSRLMIEQGDLSNIPLQYKTTLKYIMRSKRSTPTMRQFVKVLRKTWISKFQDYHILLWSTRKVPASENWFRKLRTTQIDTLFNNTYDRINHLIPSVQNQNKWFMKLETLSCVNCSIRDPKHSAKYVYHIGTSASSIARAGTSCEKGERKIRNSSSTRWTSSQFPTTSLSKDDLTNTAMVRRRETRNITSPTSWRRSARRKSSNVSMTSSYEMNNSAIEWLKMIETKMFVDKWMLLRTKIIPTIWHQKNIIITRVIGDFIQTRQVPILCQWSTDLTSRKRCLHCSNWNKKKKELYKRPRTLAVINNGHRVLLLHGGVGKVHGGPFVLMKVTMEMNQVLIEQGDLLYKCLEQFFKAWISWIHLPCYRWIVYNWRRSTVTDRMCKYHTSNAVARVCIKWLQGKVTINSYSMTTSWNWEQVPRWNWLGRRDQRHGTSASQMCWAKMRVHVLRCPQVSPTQSSNRRFLIEGCVDRWAKDEAYMNRENYKFWTFAWEKNSVTMQNTNNHVHYVNGYIGEGWTLSKARTSICW